MKYALNCFKVTGKTMIMLQNISILNNKMHHGFHKHQYW